MVEQRQRYICRLRLIYLLIPMMFTAVSCGIPEKIGEYTGREIFTGLMLWALLFLISGLSIRRIADIVDECENLFRRRAYFIAITIGLVLIFILFKQPYLESLFEDYDAEGIVKILLFGGGWAGGWLSWYLIQLKKYGDFFEVLLYTVVSGFCWYAKLIGPKEVQLTAMAFLVGSLFQIARDYIARSEEVR